MFCLLKEKIAHESSKEWRKYKMTLICTKYEPPHDKTNNVAVHPVKTQISLGICPVWSESSMCAQWVAKDWSFLHADSEDSDQTGWMPRLIWVFTGRTATLLVLSWGGSYVFLIFCYFLILSHRCHENLGLCYILPSKEITKNNNKVYPNDPKFSDRPV